MTNKWIGKIPEQCDVCKKDINRFFIDGATITGRWGIMCPECHSYFGRGLGTGKGQIYDKDGNKITIK